MSYKRAVKEGIPLKKRFGQHFLQDKFFVDQMIHKVKLDEKSSVFEIGCGDGFLTESILQENIKELRVFEIDQEWAGFIARKFKKDQRLTVYEDNILDIDLKDNFKRGGWTLLSNLPYNITFPILHLIYKNRSVVDEGVVMMQEEVAQKILRTSGRGYGYPSLFFQHYFEWERLEKVPPTAFYPPPKVFSRLLYFKTRKDPAKIPHEEGFWKFIKICFHQPRRTLRNNFSQSHYDLALFPDDLLKKRAQEIGMQDFLKIWDGLRTSD